MTTFIQAITLTVSIVIMVLVAKWQVNNDIKKMQKRLDKETNNKEKTMSKDITEDILLRAGFKKTSNSLFVLRRADYAIELLNLHFACGRVQAALDVRREYEQRLYDNENFHSDRGTLQQAHGADGY